MIVRILRRIRAAIALDTCAEAIRADERRRCAEQAAFAALCQRLFCIGLEPAQRRENQHAARVLDDLAARLRK